jgi:hypothetical protein
MNHTPTQIAAALAPYLGQRVKITHMGTTPFFRDFAVGDTEYLTWVLFEYIASGALGVQLKARVLSSLTDDEAREVARLATDRKQAKPWLVERTRDYITVKASALRVEQLSLFFDEFASIIAYGSGSSTAHHNTHQITDYLRSIGIDIPSHHLNGQTLHSAGLAVYETETLNAK